MIVDAFKRMRTSHVGDLVVIEIRKEQHVPLGIVTKRDIVIAAVAGDSDHINCLSVGEVMSSDLVTAREQDTIDVALKKMYEHGVQEYVIKAYNVESPAEEECQPPSSAPVAVMAPTKGTGQ